MKNLAPGIVRQRLLMGGLNKAPVDEAAVRAYRLFLAAHLNLQSYGEPVVHRRGGIGKAENHGFDAFLSLIDPGISLYVLESSRFFLRVGVESVLRRGAVFL